MERTFTVPTDAAMRNWSLNNQTVENQIHSQSSIMSPQPRLSSSGWRTRFQLFFVDVCYLWGYCNECVSACDATNRYFISLHAQVKIWTDSNNKTFRSPWIWRAEMECVSNEGNAPLQQTLTPQCFYSAPHFPPSNQKLQEMHGLGTFFSFTFYTPNF